MSSATGRILLVALGVVALSLVIVARRLGKGPPPDARPAPPAAPVASPAAAPASAAPRPTAPSILVAVPQRPLIPDGFRFDPTGRFIGHLRPDRPKGTACEVWSLELGLFVGEVDAARCTAWRPGTCVDFRPPERGEAGPEVAGSWRSRFGQTCLSWPIRELTAAAASSPATARASAALVRVRLAGQPELPLRPECDGDACTDVVGLALSPDGKQLAIARQGQSQIRIIDLASSRLVTTLELGNREQVQPLMLVWGQAGLLAVVAAPGQELVPPEHGYINSSRTVYQWSDLQLPPQKGSCGAEVNVTNAAALFDPGGRYLLMLQHFERSGDKFVVLDGRPLPPTAGDFRSALSRTRPLGGRPYSRCDVDTQLTPGRWLPGPFPVWETVETTRTSCPDPGGEKVTRVARLLHTAPAFHRMTQVKLEGGAVTAARHASSDGKTVIPGAGQQPLAAGFADRFAGAGKDAIRRISDGEILYYPEDDSCFHTERGAVSCPEAKSLRERLYLLGPDPLTDEIVRGDQLAWLLYTPSLVDDFFAGRPLPPATNDPRLGHSPSLSLVSIERHDDLPQNLTVKVAARDGGGGLSLLRVRVGDKLLPDSFPLTAAGAGTVSLSLDTKVCDYAYIYACSKGGVVCSRPVAAPFCPAFRHVPEDNLLYDAHED